MPVSVRVRACLAMSVVGVAAMVSAAQPVIVYDSQGFEAPLFAPVALEKQDGWTSDFAPDNAFVQTAVVRSGSQAVRLSAAGLSGVNWWFKPLNYTVNPAATPLVYLTYDLMVDSSTPASGSWGFEIFDPSFTARYGLSSISNSLGTFTTQRFDIVGINNTGVVIPKNTWKRYRVVLDFAAKTSTFFVNGAQAGPVVVWDSSVFIPGLTIADADFRVTGPGADNCYIDNYSVVAARRPCAGDADGNGVVNFSDVTTTLANFGGTTLIPNISGDADGNETVNFSDVTSVLANFGGGCAN